MENEIIIKRPETPTDLLSQAIDKDLDIEKLERLMAMKERYDKDQSRKLFFEALADFQNRCPELRKNKKVSAKLKEGGTLEYDYAPLSDIDRQIKELMKECGLTKRWEFEDDKGTIKVSCIITHTSGHFERTTMSAQADDSGKKNSIQARGSSIEYMKRYTLIGALGLTTADNDIDGRFTEKNIDELHKEYMKMLTPLYQKEPDKYGKYLPENWKTEATAKIYVRAIGEMRKLVFEDQQHGTNKK